jgi:cytosine/adenosine deaminase-related metal-dependent hydrolase
MMHYTRVQGLTDLPTEVAEVARAARDVGVRVGFAVALRDRHPLVYGPSEPILAALPAEIRAEVAARLVFTPRAPAEQIALVDAVAEAAGSPTFEVHYGPTGVQWCSDALLRAVAAASARTGRRVHMHLLETRYQRAYLDAAFPGGVVPYLDAIGLLSPRLTLAHCVWARPDELELLAARGVTIALNTSSNLHLRSGIAPLGEMLKAGCRVALGIDATALDEDDDGLREMRLAHLLHVGTGFRTAVSRDEMLRLAVETGHAAIMNRDGGRLAPGAAADILLIDWAALDPDRLRDDLDPRDLLFARATKAHIDELIVAGRSIVRGGRVLGVDAEAAREEVRAVMRRGLAADTHFARSLAVLSGHVARHYEPDAPCC